MPARALVIGLDGADLDLIESLGPSETPEIHRLMARGAFARLESVLPPATLPNWTTFLTGVDPGVHGVFDFTLREGYRVRFAAGTAREAPTIAARLDRLGLSCAVVGFPGTWPPERLESGVFISGWDSPVAFEADRSFVWPPARYDWLRERFGPLRFDEVDELHADAPGWHSRLPAALVARVRERVELGKALLDERGWDLFALYFGESDTAAHHLWALSDPSSPRHPSRVSEEERDGLARVYRALDAAVGELVEAAGHAVEITLVSDHGSGGAGDKVLYLNRALEEAGYLRFRPPSPIAALGSRAKSIALGSLGPRMRERLFRARGRALPGWAESQARFGAIDWSATRVFSDELNYFPSLSFNVAGREPAGQVSNAALPALREEVSAWLEGLRDPWSGERILRAVWPREALYRGPFVERAPDLILELALDGGYSYNLMPSASAPPGTGPWRRLGPEEHLGKKGRALQGSHRERGLFVAAGPRVAPRGEVRARMADATATLLARLDIAPDGLDGRVLREALQRRGASTRLPEVQPSPRGVGDESRVEARLRALGYIE